MPVFQSTIKGDLLTIDLEWIKSSTNAPRIHFVWDAVDAFQLPKNAFNSYGYASASTLAPPYTSLMKFLWVPKYFQPSVSIF